jgi:predicted phosphodiesterase
VDPKQLRPADEEQRERAAQFSATRSALGEPTLRALARLPRQLRMPLLDGTELLLVHGSPADPLTCLSHELDDEEMETLLANDGANIVVCGGTHVPFRRRVDDIEIVNVGSVGEAPEGACAHFSIITPKLSGTQIEQAWVGY